MEQKAYQELTKKVNEALGKTHLGGLKGEVLHEYIRAAVTNLHFKWIQRGDVKVKDSLEELKESIEQHLVLKSEKAQEKAVRKVIADHVYLYLTLHSLLLYEKHDLEELIQFTKEFKKTFNSSAKGKTLPKEAVRDTVNMLLEAIRSWNDEIDQFREELNAVWARAGDRSGWSLGFFEKMHNVDGYFARFKERRLFRSALKDSRLIEKNIGQLHNVKNVDELEKILKKVGEESKEIVNDFKIISKILYATWDDLTAHMDNLIEVVSKAADIHELPSEDSKQMHELHILINTKINQQYLHALRIDDKQLEAILVDLKNDVEELKKAA